MNRYSKYFLQHILWLDDGFCQYYVQDDAWGLQEILDVQAVIFDESDEAEAWLRQCAEHDHFATMRGLRVFLADHCLENYLVHRMDDTRVLCAAARQISRNSLRVVIRPGLGWAVQVDAQTAETLQPPTVEPEPELARLHTELKAHLDALVVAQQKKYDQYEAELARLSDSEKLLLYGKKAGGAAYDSAVNDPWRILKAAPGAIWKAAKAFPGFYAGCLKTL